MRFGLIDFQAICASTQVRVSVFSERAVGNLHLDRARFVIAVERGAIFGARGGDFPLPVELAVFVVVEGAEKCQIDFSNACFSRRVVC